MGVFYPYIQIMPMRCFIISRKFFFNGSHTFWGSTRDRSTRMHTLRDPKQAERKRGEEEAMETPPSAPFPSPPRFLHIIAPLPRSMTRISEGARQQGACAGGSLD